MSTWGRRLAAAAVVAMGVAAATPAAAQFSDAYKFIKAVKDKDGTVANKLLSANGTTIVNVRDGDTGETALHIVTRQRDLGWIGFLLQHDANPALRDRDGATPLLLAATIGFSEGVRVLLLVKSPVDAANRLGETPLLRAVHARDATTVRLLLDAGANPDFSDNAGNTPRKLALADGRGGPVARLLKDAPARAAKPAQGPVL